MRRLAVLGDYTDWEFASIQRELAVYGKSFNLCRRGVKLEDGTVLLLNEATLMKNLKATDAVLYAESTLSYSSFGARYYKNVINTARRLGVKVFSIPHFDFFISGSVIKKNSDSFAVATEGAGQGSLSEIKAISEHYFLKPVFIKSGSEGEGEWLRRAMRYFGTSAITTPTHESFFELAPTLAFTVTDSPWMAMCSILSHTPPYIDVKSGDMRAVATSLFKASDNPVFLPFTSYSHIKENKAEVNDSDFVCTINYIKNLTRGYVSCLFNQHFPRC